MRQDSNLENSATPPRYISGENDLIDCLRKLMILRQNMSGLVVKKVQLDNSSLKMLKLRQTLNIFRNKSMRGRF